MKAEKRDNRSGLWARRLAGAFLYAGRGMMFEVGATGLGRGPQRNFHGGVSLLMGILYALVIEPLLKTIGMIADFLYADGLLTWKGFWAVSKRT